MLTFNYGSPYFWDKVVLIKFISGCRVVWDLISGTSWPYKSRTEKVIAGKKSAILPNWCCLLFITVMSGYPCLEWEKVLRSISAVGSSGTDFLIICCQTADCWFVDVIWAAVCCCTLCFLFLWITMFLDYLHLQHNGVEFCRVFINLRWFWPAAPWSDMYP